MAQRSLLVTSELAGPLDRAVRGLFDTSWGRARSWIAAGKVRVGGKVATDSTARVGAGVAIDVDEAAPRPRAGRLTDADIVFVDAQIVVVSKPAGVSTVPFDDRETDSLDARVRGWLERRHAGRSGRPTLGIVHRLDKETSGLIVFTRTWMAKQRLASQFRLHSVHRRYLAIAHGAVRARTIRTWLMEDRGDGLRGSARGIPPASAREAVTHVEPVERLDGATLVACRLETGRTHQIRIHLSEMGSPIAGEHVYVRGFAGPVIAAPRLMLHAAELGLVHPATNREMRWESPLPDDMSRLLEKLRAGRSGDAND